MGATSSVKVNYSCSLDNSTQIVQISVHSPKKGAEVITAVHPEFEMIVKALASSNVKFIQFFRAYFANPDSVSCLH